MCQTTTAGPSAAEAAGPSTAADALAFVEAGLDWLAAADATDLTGAERADLLRGLARAESVHLAATARVLSAFDAAEDYAADGQAGPRAWLRWQTRVSRPAAGASVAWMRRLATRRQVAAALEAGQLSVSYARRLCDWIDELPEDVRETAERILVQAAANGADLGELAALAEEIRARTARPDADDDERRFAQRSVLLDTYYRGNGYLRGDLTPPAAAALHAVLDSLGAKAGPEDTRSREQRAHDALEEACRRLIASGCLPERAGQPVQIVLHMTLAQLLGQTEFDPALAAWIGANAVTAPPGADCDAAIVPIVTGTIDPGILTDLVDRYLGAAGSDGNGGADCTHDADSGRDTTQANHHDPAAGTGNYADGSFQDCTGHDSQADGAADSASNSSASNSSAPDGSAPDIRTPDDRAAAEPMARAGDQTLGRARRAAAGLTINDALRLLSGPAGLASWLRGQLPSPASSVSLPLDVGTTADIPAHIRRAVTRRDHHCRFPGCDQPPAVCHVHHLRRRADGGTTTIANCCLLCPFHHLTAVHRWGWQLTLNPDGTTTATSPDGRRVLHSHAPPTAA